MYKRFFQILTIMSCSQLSLAGVWVAPLDEDGETDYVPTPKYVEVDASATRQYLPASDDSNSRVAVPAMQSQTFKVERLDGDPVKASKGVGVPLKLAVLSVLPDGGDGWVVNTDGRIDESRKITWTGGDEWKDILTLMGSQNGFVAAVSEAQKTVGISSDPGYAALLSNRNADISGIRDARAHQVRSIPVDKANNVSDGSKVWFFQQDKTVMQNFQLWADRAGWTLNWDHSKDFKSVASAQFVGTFSEAVREASFALANSGLPIGIETYRGNKVLRVYMVK